MSFNISINRPEILKNDSLQAKTVKETPKVLTDNIVDLTTENKDLSLDFQGAIATKQDVYLKTDKGIVKIAKEQLPQIINNLKTNLAKKDEYHITGFGLDLKGSELKVNFNIKDGKPEPEINEIKTIPTINTKPWKGLTAENIKEFKQIFPLAQGSPPIIKEPSSSIISDGVFSCSVKDLQALVGEKEANGKFSVKTFALVQEYLATKINQATNFDDLEILHRQLNKLKDYLPNIQTNPRQNEITTILNAKIDKFVAHQHKEVTTSSDIEKLSDIRLKLVQLKGSTKDLDQLINIIDEKITKLINKGISQATTIEDVELESIKIDELPDDFPLASKDLLNKNLQFKLTNCVHEKIDSIKTSTLIDLNTCLRLAARIDSSISSQLSPEAAKDLKEKVGLKLVSILNERMKSTSNLTEYKDLESKIEKAKPFIPQGSYDYFKMALKITFDKSELYGDKGITGINYSKVVQGNLNDCFFLSSVAGLAAKRPQEIAKMITVSPDGKLFTVKFPGALQEVTVSRPSEEYMRKHAHKTGDNGIWVAVLEKAYSQYLVNMGVGSNSEDTTDNINHGNLLSPGIEVMTGNPTDTDLLSTLVNSYDTTREKLTEAMKNNRVVTASTFQRGAPENGIPTNHVYTILDYNPQTDKVKIRNPWAQSPTGGIDGYTPKKAETDPDPGVFELSIGELYKYFNLIAYEQEPGFSPLSGGGIY